MLTTLRVHQPCLPTEDALDIADCEAELHISLGREFSAFFGITKVTNIQGDVIVHDTTIKRRVFLLYNDEKP